MPMPSELEKNEVRKEQKAQYKKQQERAMKEELREEMQQACYRGRACASDARPLRIAATKPGTGLYRGRSRWQDRSGCFCSLQGRNSAASPNGLKKGCCTPPLRSRARVPAVPSSNSATLQHGHLILSLFLPLCFSASLFSLLLCYCVSAPFYFYYFIFSFLQSCVFAVLLPAPLLLCFLSLPSLCFLIFFCFFLFCLYPKWNPRETLGETQRNPNEILIRNPTWSPKWTLKKPWINPTETMT